MLTLVCLLIYVVTLLNQIKKNGNVNMFIDLYFYVLRSWDQINKKQECYC